MGVVCVMLPGLTACGCSCAGRQPLLHMRQHLCNDPYRSADLVTWANCMPHQVLVNVRYANMSRCCADVGGCVCAQGQGRAVTCLDIDPSGSRLVTGSLDYTVRMFDFSGMKSDLRSFR